MESRKSLLDPPDNEREPVGTTAIAQFEDLKLEMKVLVWDHRDDRWRSGVVHKFRELPATRDLPAKTQVSIRTTGATHFLYSTSWDRTRGRVRAVEASTRTEADMLVDLGVSREGAEERVRKKNARQAAKSASFVAPNEVPPIDGMTPGAIFAMFQDIQREKISPIETDVTKPRYGQHRLTPKQLESARSMWAGGLARRVVESELEDKRRAPTVVVDHYED